MASRPPNASELFSDGLHHALARIEIGDIKFNKEIANRIASSYSYRRIQDLIILIEVFYIEPTGVESTNRGAFPVWEYKQVNAALFGVDWNIRYNITEKFVIQNKSSFIKGKDLSSDRALIDIPSFKTVNLIRYTNEKWANFNAEIQSEWIFRQNEFPDNNFEAFIPRTDSYVLVDISSPPPAYHLLNVRSDFDLKISKKDNVRVAFSINNLLNTSYRENLNRLRYFADEIGRNFSIQLIYNY